MKKKTFGVLALVVVGVLAVSFAFAMPFGNSENRDAARAAVENGDYDAWKAAVTADLTEENFDKMVSMYNLKEQIREARKAGDNETVDSLMEQIKELAPEGFGRGHGMGFGHGFENGMHKGCPFVD